jgi:cobalt-zinc-cadmium efflux system protein
VHEHSHSRAGAELNGKLRRAFYLTLLILGVEVMGGFFSHSLALLSDAGHVLTDAIAIAFAWFAAWRARRPADARNTYGYHRTGILAALLNSATLILIVGWIGYEAVGRIRRPEPVMPWLMFVSASVGIAVNLYIGLGLRSDTAGNLNARAARLHALGDVGASGGVIVGALVILLTGWQYADPLLSLGIAVLIVKGAWSLLRESLDILMEATPRDLDLGRLVEDVARIPGVADLHDLHVWTISGGMRFLSAHVQVSDNRTLDACDRLVDAIHLVLCERYGIEHTTLQIELAGCEHQDLYCDLPDRGHPHRHRESR